MGKLTRLVVASSLSLCSLVASGESERPLYIIFDGSNSMWGELQDSSRKIETAQTVFEQLDDSLFENRQVALRIYGHRREADCTDTELVAPFASGKSTRENLAKIIGSVTPRGRTPIRLSLEAALQDFDGAAGDIFLISDGVETCDADPCELVASWRDENIDIRVHVVGLGLTPAAQSAMQCLAAASGTHYMEAESTDELSAAITTFATSPNLIGQNNPLTDDQHVEFKIIATDDQGRELPAAGELIDTDGYHYAISANKLYELESGEYSLTVGVPTTNGELYGTTTDTITLANSGPTVFSVVLPRPPIVSTRFLQNGDEIPGVVTAVYQDGEELMSLAPGEDHFVLPGVYEFRARVDKDNTTLIVNSTVEENTEQHVDFDVVETLNTSYHINDEMPGTPVRQLQ